LKSGKPVAPKRLQNRLTLGSLTPAAVANDAMLDRVASSGALSMALATFASDLFNSPSWRWMTASRLGSDVIMKSLLVRILQIMPQLRGFRTEILNLFSINL
jgi:hypothetical protein